MEPMVVELTEPTQATQKKDPFLVGLGERIRNVRSRRGLTRKAAAAAAGISERHLANLELGTGNASILVLQQVAGALECPLAEIIGDITTSSPEWLMIRELLDGRPEAELHRARVQLAELFSSGTDRRARLSRIALIGLRGAGKSTLGRMLAEDLGVPFVELSGEIEKLGRCSIAEIHALYGNSAYRRYERRALEETLRVHAQAVIAAPGGIVSDAGTFNVLLSHCYTVWLSADAEDHMKRVAAQGDFRPMSGSGEAMDDLKRILSGRAAFYAKADATYITSGHSLEDSFSGLRSLLRKVMTGRAERLSQPTAR
ncbi:MAG: transcriptional regulator [Betaproteobacteria bacterium RIFCSPLOWO2_02_FULL_65_24]|nr:MAG: transcriptional regulator [Betaproteobacteria bacterium RIFCSPLOWO2_02_FULL_65_24]